MQGTLSNIILVLVVFVSMQWSAGEEENKKENESLCGPANICQTLYQFNETTETNVSFCKCPTGKLCRYQYDIPNGGPVIWFCDERNLTTCAEGQIGSILSGYQTSVLCFCQLPLRLKRNATNENILNCEATPASI